MVNSARPAIGKYSWLRFGSSRSLSSACRASRAQLAVMVVGLRYVADLLDDRKDPGFGVVVSIGSNTQIHLLVKGVFSVCGHQPKERVFGGLGDMVRGKDGRIIAVHVAFDACESVGRVASCCRVWRRRRGHAEGIPSCR